MNQLSRLLLVFALLSSTYAWGQTRFLAFDAPGSYKNRVRIQINEEISIKLKGDQQFYTGILTHVTDSNFSINNVPILYKKVDRIRVKRDKKRNILLKLVGFGAQGYLVIRLINSAISSSAPPISVAELAITIPIIVFYYIYDFLLNRRVREYKVTKERPLKPIILEPSFSPY